MENDRENLRVGVMEILPRSASEKGEVMKSKRASIRVASLSSLARRVSVELRTSA